MKSYFKDANGKLRIVEGELPIHNQAKTKYMIYQDLGIIPSSAVLQLVVDNKPKTELVA